MAQTRPTYKTEPREDLEERLRIISGLLATAVLRADDEGCGCATCGWLRELGVAVDPAAAISVNFKSIATNEQEGDENGMGN